MNIYDEDREENDEKGVIFPFSIRKETSNATTIHLFMIENFEIDIYDEDHFHNKEFENISVEKKTLWQNFQTQLIHLKSFIAARLSHYAGNRSREGGHPQGWKAQTRREMADEMAW